jgi:hypothetical protein
MTELFETKNLGFASFLRYCLGPDAHRSTRRDAKGFTYTFTPADECQRLERAYFAREPFAVGDIRAFNANVQAMKFSMNRCRDTGVWFTEQEERV